MELVGHKYDHSCLKKNVLGPNIHKQKLYLISENHTTFSTTTTTTNKKTSTCN